MIRRFGQTAVMVAMIIVASGCTRFATPVAPIFTSSTDHMQGWHRVGIPSSAPATDVATALIPNLLSGARHLDSLYPAYAPAPGADRVTWDSLVPTGEVFVVSTDATAGVSRVFSIRPDAGGTWSYNIVPYSITEGHWFLDGMNMISRSLAGRSFEVRFVPTAAGWLDWMVVRAAGDVYAVPIRVAPGGLPHPIVDGQRLEVGQLRPPDAIVHDFTGESSSW